MDSAQSAKLDRLRYKAKRLSMTNTASQWKYAFLDAMEVIEEQQIENARLLQAIADAGIRAGELTAKVIDRERRLNQAKLIFWDIHEDHEPAAGIASEGMDACNLSIPLAD